MPDKPKILSMDMAIKALGDDNFYKALPEFSALKTLHAQAGSKLKTRGGCSKCRKRRVASGLYRNFISITMSLDNAGRQRLKNYFNSGIMVTRQNPQTKQYETQII